MRKSKVLKPNNCLVATKFEYLSHYLLDFHKLICTVPTVTKAETDAAFKYCVKYCNYW